MDEIGQLLGVGERVDIVDVFRRPLHVAGIFTVMDRCLFRDRAALR